MAKAKGPSKVTENKHQFQSAIVQKTIEICSLKKVSLLHDTVKAKVREGP
jgi:hypothetical protein